jgi:TRAP-type mannitol/chloroaromatic compound transport system substrate-binding protein
MVGITEDYTVGWADVTDYFLTNNISGAWIGSWFANEEKWNALPEHLKQLYISCMEATHTFRNQWYWGGEAKLRATGDKLQLRSVPASEWKQVEDAAKVFWDEIAAESETKAKVISIFKEYNEVINAAGFPYGES